MAYVTLGEIKEFLSISGTTDDQLLTELIDRGQKVIEKQTDRVFESAAAVERLFDAVVNVENRDLLFGRDCANITSVVNGDGVTVAATSYTTIPANAVADGIPFWGIRLKGSTGLSWTYTDDPEGAISITAHWAYSESPPEDVRHALIRLVHWLYRQRDSVVDTPNVIQSTGVVLIPPSLPRDVSHIIKNYQRVSFGEFA